MGNIEFKLFRGEQVIIFNHCKDHTRYLGEGEFLMILKTVYIDQLLGNQLG